MTLLSEKHDELKHAIADLFATKPDWIKFYREVMGLHGLVRRAFPTVEAMAEFEQTETYHQIHRMVTELRKKAPPEDLEEEETKFVTVRIPKSLHEALRIEAFEHRTSLNKLCISKFIQFSDAGSVPATFNERSELAGERAEGARVDAESFRAAPSEPDKPAERKFGELVAQWHDECKLSSSITDICTNMAYQQIIAMGTESLQFIFRELEKRPDHWFWALKAITGHNPVPAEAIGDMEAMTNAWLDWARRNNYL